MANSTAPRTYQLYQYSPSIAGAVIFVLLFLSTTTLHLYQMFKKRTWFLTPLVIGGCFEFIGYAARSKSASEATGHNRLMPFVIQNTYILLAPALFAATIYMTLGRVINLIDGDEHAIISGQKLTRIFLLGDVFCFVMQSVGGTLTALAMTKTTSSKAKMGQNIILTGIILQLFWFGFFMVIAWHLQYRMNRNPTAASRNPDYQWRKYLNSLYIVSALVIVRSIFRVIEFAQGHDGYLQSHEVFFYVFDSIPMFALLVWLNWQHPGEIGILLRKTGTGTVEYVMGTDVERSDDRK
ncbi:RTA1-domain-containing protein [Melanomma pulvis-pyrius CBS 109.77]|uniref:RTA1-domain-containing protein n=1 Tax=Melanomma pulvis-pyrius CBS 109.77 TaxID=1314802 RepID=A0A6A6XUW3_9PLEO|nr:RTA1-domain-containing protein [Melanomma pulvis-pyrius CBS 109.77]